MGQGSINFPPLKFNKDKGFNPKVQACSSFKATLKSRSVKEVIIMSVLPVVIYVIGMESLVIMSRSEKVVVLGLKAKECKVCKYFKEVLNAPIIYMFLMLGNICKRLWMLPPVY